MVVVFFKIELRPDLPSDEYEALGEKMGGLVSAMPGFLGMDYAATDGGEMLVARFESHEALAAWRNNPEHLEAQKLGRERYYSHYRIEVTDEVRSYEFPNAPAGAARGS